MNTVFSMQDTIKDNFEIQDKTLQKYKGNDAECSVPEGVETIAEGAFTECKYLRKVILPGSVTTIEPGAFLNCRRLTCVECDPELRVDIDKPIFLSCNSLMDEDGFLIALNVLWAYRGKSSSVVIPEGVLAIAEDVFREGPGSRSNGAYSSFNRGYRPFGSLKSISLPSSLEVIGKHAFHGCNALTELDLPQKITSIQEETFAECRRLTRISLPPYLKSIENRAFYACRSLKSLFLPPSLEQIGEEALGHCKQLETITLPEGLTEISQGLLTGCEALESLTIPPSVRCIHPTAFHFSGITEFIVEGNDGYHSKDGMLYRKAEKALIHYPGAKKEKKYTIPEEITHIASKAFYDCQDLKELVVPGHVTILEDQAFFIKEPSLKKIHVDLNAGSVKKGIQLFHYDAMYTGQTLYYPELPIGLEKNSKIQLALAVSFCDHPESYPPEYTRHYKLFLQTNHSYFLTLAKQKGYEKVIHYLKTICIPKIEQPVSYPNLFGSIKDGVYQPDFTVYARSHLKKVLMLEEAVLFADLQVLEKFLKKYQPFEMTSRALGIAGRYRGLDYVKLLYQYGASFRSDLSAAALHKYEVPDKQLDFLAYDLLVPAEMNFEPKRGYTESRIPPRGLHQLKRILDHYEGDVLDMSQRIEIIRFILEFNPRDISLSELLFYALMSGEIAFADELMALGADLSQTHEYYENNKMKSYLDVLVENQSCFLFDVYKKRVIHLSRSNPGILLEILPRLDSIAMAAQKKISWNKQLFHRIYWNDALFSCFLDHTDYSGFSKKMLIEHAVSNGYMTSLKKMAALGWLQNRTRREAAIQYAMDKKCLEALAWLVDYKAKTVDPLKEAEYEEKKMMRELMISPTSVAVLKKSWNYRKLENGTLAITGYKGEETEVEIPARIGRSRVSIIEQEAFSPLEYYCMNGYARKAIRKIIIPEGITHIMEYAFAHCSSLESISIPSTIEYIAENAFTDTPISHKNK